MAIYEPLLAAAPKGDLIVQKDVRYGEHERNLVDMYGLAASRRPRSWCTFMAEDIARAIGI